MLIRTADGSLADAHRYKKEKVLVGEEGQADSASESEPQTRGHQVRSDRNCEARLHLGDRFVLREDAAEVGIFGGGRRS